MEAAEPKRPRHHGAILAALEAGLCTAHSLARQLGITERSIYRNIAQLKADGVPIKGEAGVGYMLRRQPGVSQ